MRMPRTEAAQRSAKVATSPGPSPIARNRSSSIAVRSAAVRWNAVKVSNTSAGEGVGAAEGPVDMIYPLPIEIASGRLQTVKTDETGDRRPPDNAARGL